MKQITFNIPDDFADAITVTCIGGVGKPDIHITVDAFDISKVIDKAEFDVKAGGKVAN